jgi:putative ABC transport system permease protein
VPEWRRYVRTRLLLPALNREREAAIVDELAQQLEDAYDRARRGGASEDEALEFAQHEINDWNQLAHEITTSNWRHRKHLEQRVSDKVESMTGSTAFFGDLISDAMYAFRLMRRTPGFTAVVVLTLALGVGANAAIFSLVHATLLRPLPYTDPDHLVHLWDTKGTGVYEKFEASFPDFADWKQHTVSFADLGGYAATGHTVLGGEAPERIAAGRVTWNFFSVLGVRPILGRTFLKEEELAEGPAAVMLSHGYWQQHFGADPNAVGRTMSLDGTLFTIVGVLPADFNFAPIGGSLAWTPLRMDRDRATRRSNHWLNVIARLKAGVTLDAADAELKTLAGRLAEQYPDSNAGVSARAVSLRLEISGRTQPILLVLMSAVGLVLLIACANVANLMLARAASREKEFAIRSTLGARRMRLARQLVAEGLVLAILGGAAGLLWASWGTKGLLTLVPQQVLAGMPYLQHAALNRDVLLFTLAVACLTGLLFSFAPILSRGLGTRAPLSAALKEGGRGSGASTGRERLRTLLVVSEVALALVLLVGAALVLKSLNRLLAVELGFRSDNLLTMAIRVPEARYATPEQVSQLLVQLRERMAALPGVKSVSTVSTLPASNDGNTLTFDVEGKSFPPGEIPEASWRGVSPDYFQSMGIPLMGGRTFDDRDTFTAAPVAVINQTLARGLFSREDPIGRRVTFRADGSTATIVGVVGDVRLGNLDAPVRPTLYLCDLQGAARRTYVVMRTSVQPSSMVSAVRRELNAIDRTLPLFEVRTMDEVITDSPSVFQRRFVSSVVGVFAVVALMLAIVGVYGVLSFAVTQRRHEIGVRMALGAQRRDVFRLVIGRGLMLAGIGVTLGLAVALGTTRYLTSLLFDVKPTDRATFAVVAALLMLVALVACFMPARRATRVDPIVALRNE